VWSVAIAGHCPTQAICDAQDGGFEHEKNDKDQGGAKDSPGGCFIAGTLVVMADGSMQSIEDLRVGDVVKSYDETTQTVTTKPVQNLYARIVKATTRINGTLRVTERHRFMTTRGWVAAKNLRVGDEVLSVEGRIPITSVESVEERVPVHNFTVQDTHTYYVTDGGRTYLVHNAKQSSS
jgi:hypothetical protein